MGISIEGCAWGCRGTACFAPTSNCAQPRELFAKNAEGLHFVEWSVGFAQLLQIDSELLALLIEVAALQTQRSRHVGHVKIVPPDFSKQHFLLECFRTLRKCSARNSSGCGRSCGTGAGVFRRKHQPHIEACDGIL